MLLFSQRRRTREEFVSELWTASHLGRLQILDAHDWARWFRNGLKVWYAQENVSRAFDPVADRFSPVRRIEEQIIEMYDELPDPVGRRFLEGLLIVLTTPTGSREAECWEESVGEIAVTITRRPVQPHAIRWLPN